jgi:hypothetical protein
MSDSRGYRERYAGARWSILYGSYDGVERHAVSELQEYVQRYLPYVIEVRKAESVDQIGDDYAILIGTGDNNPLIADAIARGTLAKPDGPEGYSISCGKSPWTDDRRLMTVAGSDPNGVLYGVQHLDSVLRATVGQPDPPDMRAAFDKLPEFSITEKPAIDNRGIWTWGYPIYDYKRFIDNMARCRMNMLTIWNDCPPLNSRDLIDYAHSRGVKIVYGFHWGWGIDDFDPTDAVQRRRMKDSIIRNYLDNYRDLGLDGIYFQTFTEHTKLDMGGKSTAALACEWVNEIADALLDYSPGLQIQFGLHATSIRERYTDLAGLDPRVTITWEDAGCIPYAYDPTREFNYGVFNSPTGLDPLDGTIDYSKKIATFRPGTEFAMVPKGFAWLRWQSEFEHHGPFILGERNTEFIKQRAAERQPFWDRINALWLANYPMAVRFYREILDCNPPSFTATALIEDGLFEEKIQPSVAILAETLWNPRRDEKEILLAALSPHYGG